MIIEEKIKSLILSRYRSLREFTIAIGIPYSTLSTILKRGVENANIQNIIKICQALEISADELAAGRIVPISQNPTTSVENIFASTKQQLITASNLRINGRVITKEELNSILNSLDILLEIEKRNCK